MRPRCLWVVAASALAGLAICVAPAVSGAATLPYAFNDQVILSGLSAPTAVAWTPDGRMLVTEKAGRVKVVPAGGGPATTVLDISDHVNDYWDRGLSGIAVDTDYEQNHYVYLAYVYDPPPKQDYFGPKSSRLTRFVLNDDNSLGNANSPETVILGTDSAGACPTPSNIVDCMPADEVGHMIGTVRAAGDGTLWVGNGDGSDFSGPDIRAFRTYNEASMAGKVLHIDRSGNGLPGHPFCSGDSNLDHVCTKVYSKGFRNPYRFTVRADGKVFAGDVGWWHVEEVDALKPGRNYGWPCIEGTKIEDTYEAFQSPPGEFPCSSIYAAEGGPDATEPPIYDYPHFGEDAAVLVGPFYTGGEYPDEFDGDLLIADFSRGWIKRMKLDGSDQLLGDPVDFASEVDGLVDLERSPEGRLTYVQFGFGTEGKVHEISYGGAVAYIEASSTSGPAPLQVSFDGTTSFDESGQGLEYDWDFGDGSAHSSDPAPVHTFAVGTYVATLTVTDQSGRSDTDQVEINSGTAPDVQITSPADGSQYVDGEPVALSGAATDDQDGALGDSLAWHVQVRHGTHTHLVGTFTGEQASFTPGTDHALDAHYEVELSATNSVGLTTTKKITLYPKQAWFGLYSYPVDGAPVTRGAETGATPFADWSAAGFETNVSAAPEYEANGKLYVFDGWSDGGDASHDVRIPETGLLLSALYHEEDLPPGPGGGVVPPIISLPPVPAPPGPPAAGSGAADRSGPSIELSKSKRKRGLRSLAGFAADPSGVRRVEVALYQRHGKSCRWWTKSAGRLAHHAKSCGRPRWVEARLRPSGVGRWSWRLNLGGGLPAGRYTVTFRAADWLGNESDRLGSGRGHARLTTR